MLATWVISSQEGKDYSMVCGSDENKSWKRNEPELEDKENQPPKRPKVTSAEISQKELIKEYEEEGKHEGVYSPFRYKLWAEMHAKGGHSSLEDPPAVAMFKWEKVAESSSTNNDFMASVIDKLCTAL